MQNRNHEKALENDFFRIWMHVICSGTKNICFHGKDFGREFGLFWEERSRVCNRQQDKEPKSNGFLSDKMKKWPPVQENRRPNLFLGEIYQTNRTAGKTETKQQRFR